MSVRADRDWLEDVRRRLRPRMERRSACRRPAPGERREILVCTGGGCSRLGAAPPGDLFEEEIGRAGLAGQVRVVPVGCIGLCGEGPLAIVVPDGVVYRGIHGPAEVRRIVAVHLKGGEPVADLEVCRGREIPFFARQTRVALRNCGLIDPANIAEYVARGGYRALESALFEKRPEEILGALKRSGLRGRGGAGFPVGLKWQLVREVPADRKYVVCNADEGDPGAFMDRAILEGDPHSVLEAMALAARGVGAGRGFVYVRAEYGLALERIRFAAREALGRGLLGDDVLGTGFSFHVEVVPGAGAFVCGEETALIRSLEGRRGMPRPRPPFPSQEGLWGRPTLVTNVETLANVPPILDRGPEWFSSIGTTRSRGTKVFALSGQVRNTGLVEVAMGTPLSDVVERIGGGTRSGLPFKAAHTGGPTGGCIPARAAGLPVDYESFQDLGATMGSGGLVIADEATCVVDLARYFLEFLAGESCGKCPPCRIGLRLMTGLLERIATGEGGADDLASLQGLGDHVRKTSLCGLGQNGPNPVLSSLLHFPEEYHAHVTERRCPSGRCPMRPS